MSSPFAAAAAAAAATIAAVHGVPFEYRPMKKPADPNMRSIVDPDRAIVPGLLLPFGASAARAGAGPFNQPAVKPERPGHASDRPFVSLQLSLLPYAPAKGDLLYGGDDAKLYRVAEIVPAVSGFVRLDLNEIANG